jgi:hypothetical protein
MGIANAQEKDAGLWVSVSLEKKISSFFDVELSQEFRFYENVSELGSAFTEASLQYKIFRKLRVGAEYRFIQSRRLDDSYRLRHRYAFQMIYIYDIQRFSFRLREKFQSRYTEVYSSEDGLIPKNMLRNRLMITYDLNKRYTPYLSGEIYYQLNNPKGNEIDKVRYKAGYDYELNKHHSLSIGYLIDQELNQNNPLTDFVIDIGYKFTF